MSGITASVGSGEPTIEENQATPLEVVEDNGGSPTPLLLNFENFQATGNLTFQDDIPINISALIIEPASSVTTESVSVTISGDTGDTTLDDVVLPSGSTRNTGGSQSHNNMPPYQVVNYIIALQGVFPSRS